MKANWLKSLYLVRGFAGEGKSTLALELMDGKVEQCVESDHFMTVDGVYTYDPSMRSIAGWWTWAEAFKRLLKYENVAVSNMFRTKDMIFGYIEEAQKHEIVVYVVRANSKIDPMDSWKRNQHNIPFEDFQKHLTEWEEFSDAEIFELAKKKVFVVDHQDMLEKGIITRDAD